VSGEAAVASSKLLRTFRERPQLAGTGFSSRSLVADLGMVSTRVEGQLPGRLLAYRFRPQSEARARCANQPLDSVVLQLERALRASV